MSDPNENNKPAPPTYVTQYQMTREPFGETIENDLYYAEPGRQQKLDILLHLTQYGNELVIVTGPRGSGKTTLLHQYLLKGLNTWSVAHIDAQSGIDERKLLQQLFHQMGMDFQGATHLELFKRMQHHFDALQHSARQAVMLIDNAEQLPVTALKRILEMAELTGADNKPLLRVILFGTNRLNENFDDPLLTQYDHIVRRNVELLPFDQEHTAHYILHRLSAANFSANKPFTDAALHKIHKQSDGWPGRINLLAHNILLETLPVGGINAEGAPAINIRHLSIALAGLVFVGVLFFFQDQISELISPQTNNTTPAPTPAAQTAVTHSTDDPISADLPADQPVTDTIATNDPLMGEAATEETTVQTSPIARLTDTRVDKPNSFAADTETDTASTTETATPEAANDIAQQTSANTDTKTTTPTTLVKSRPTEEPAVLPITTASTATELTGSPVIIPDDLPGMRLPWIRQQDPAHFTLQLVAGNNLKTLRNYLSKHHPAGPLAIYHTTREGQPWFGLIQQSFPSKQAAIDARSKLPAAMRKQQPWVRSFASLQKDLDAASP